jgi:hypothetical protein
MKRLPFVRGDKVEYVEKHGHIFPPDQGEKGIVEEDFNNKYSVLWEKHGWQAWFYPKELKFVSSRTFKTLKIVERFRDGC